MTKACHEFTIYIDMMITHIKMTCFINNSDQMTFNNRTAAIMGSDYIILLLIIKKRLAPYFSIAGVVNGTKRFVVIIDHIPNPL
jgi:hypothetical protein